MRDAEEKTDILLDLISSVKFIKTIGGSPGSQILDILRSLRLMRKNRE